MRAQVSDDESGQERDPPGDGLGEAGGAVAGGRDLAPGADLSLQVMIVMMIMMIMIMMTSHCSMAGQGRASLCSSQALTAVIAVTAGPCLPGNVVTNYSNYSNMNIPIVFSIRYSILFKN